MDSNKADDSNIILNIYNQSSLTISPVTFLGYLLIFIFAIRTVAAIFINKLILSFCRDIQISLRTTMMRSYQNLSYEKFVTKDSSDAINNITILTMYFTNNVLYGILKAFAELLLAIFIVSFLFFVNTLLVIALFGILFILVFVYSSFFRNLMSSYGKKINTANSKAVQAVSQSLAGLKEVRILGKEIFFYKRLKENAVQYATMHANSVLVITSSKYFIEFSVMTFFIVIITTSSFLISTNVADVFGVVGMFAFAAIRLLPGVSIVSSAVLQLRAHKDTVDRLYQTVKALDLKTRSKYKENELASKSVNDLKEFNLISLKDITYKYPSSENFALRNLNMTIHRGESIGIIGSSGAGKTTLIDILLGLLDPSSGTIMLDDKPISEAMDSWRNLIAYIPQESLLINESLALNIMLSDKLGDSEEFHLSETIEKAQLNEVILNLSNGIESNLGEGGIKLSGGQRQRVSLARAIFHSRDILIFDEATSALDTETEKEVMKEIIKMKGTKTLILVAHRTETLKFCDRIFELKQGSIIKSGSPKEILGKID
jgi:ABC-type bacteriocin/lantibiotic exporter with double-glycine peptidase domain